MPDDGSTWSGSTDAALGRFRESVVVGDEVGDDNVDLHCLLHVGNGESERAIAGALDIEDLVELGLVSVLNGRDAGDDAGRSTLDASDGKLMSRR